MEKIVFESLNEFMNSSFLSLRDISHPVDLPELDEEGNDYVNKVDQGILKAVSQNYGPMKIYRILWPADNTPESKWDYLEKIGKSLGNLSNKVQYDIIDDENIVYGTVEVIERPEGIVFYASLDYNEYGSYYLGDEKMLQHIMNTKPRFLSNPSNGIDF